jgi:hypothetical protein
MSEPALDANGEERFAWCQPCGYLMTWFDHSQLRFTMSCPACGCENQFGPGVYMDEFHGYTLAEAMRHKVGRTVGVDPFRRTRKR